MDARNTLQVRAVDTVTVIDVVNPRLIDQVHIERFREELLRTVETLPLPNVVVNLEKVEYFSSGAISALIELHTNIQSGGGRMGVSNLSTGLRGLFKTIKLDRVMGIYDSDREAIESFR